VRALSISLVVLAGAALADPSPEVALTLLSLRAGERARLEKAQGPLEGLPLYRAQLELDPSRREVTGKVFITWVAKGQPLTELYLRLNANQHQARVKLSHASMNGTPLVLEQPEPTLYRVKLGVGIQPGSAAAVELKLTARIPAAATASDSLVSGGLSATRDQDYGAFAAAPEIVSLTGLLPGVPPRRADGELAQGPSGIGDFGDFEPALWLVNLTVPSQWEVVAPGHALGEVPEQGGKTRYSFGICGARDFVLFATRGYEVSRQTLDDITVESHYLGSDKEAGQRVLKYAVDSLIELQKRLGPYPYSTFRVVEARLTGGAGGMEFPGLVTVSTALYRGAADPLAALGMPGLGALPQLQSMLGELKPMLESTLEFTVAHEAAHQWFAMMVGSDAIEEPVVDEPLTQHAALLYLEWKHGKAAADGMRQAQLKTAYHLMRMMGGSDAPANRPTREFETSSEYAALIYGKAPLFYDQARKLVGDEKYFKTLRNYCDELRWGFARTDTFTRMLGKAVPSQAKPLEKLRRHWWNETHGDEDLGKPDLGAMFGGSPADPNSGGESLDPSTMKLLEDAIRAMEGE
jgi:hypothetical protein